MFFKIIIFTAFAVGILAVDSSSTTTERPTTPTLTTVTERPSTTATTERPTTSGMTTVTKRPTTTTEQPTTTQTTTQATTTTSSTEHPYFDIVCPNRPSRELKRACHSIGWKLTCVETRQFCDGPFPSISCPYPSFREVVPAHWVCMGSSYPRYDKEEPLECLGSMNFEDAQDTCLQFNVSGTPASLCSLINIVRDHDGGRGGARSPKCGAHGNHLASSDECPTSSGHMVYERKRDLYECRRDKNCRQVACCATFPLE